MAFDPTSYPVSPFRGTPYYQTANIGRAPTMSPRAVPLEFNWTTYFAAMNSAQNISVEINLAGGTPQGGALDNIRGVMIDNTNSTVPITVYFPDTGYIVACPAQEIVTSPAVTNGLRAFVVAQGLVTGFLPVTRIFLSNYFMPSWSNAQVQNVFPKYVGTPSIQRNASQLLTPGFNYPALGDEIISTYVDLFTGGAYPVFNEAQPQANGVYIITSLQLNLYSIQKAAGFQLANLELRGNISGTVLTMFIFSAAGIALVNNNKLYDFGQMQWRLPADESYTFVVPAAFSANAAAHLYGTYTYDPNG